MNRRELLKAAGAAIAAAGVETTVEAIDAEPRPMMLVLSLPDDIAECDVVRMSEQFKALIPNCPPIVVLPHGCRLTPVVVGQGVILNMPAQQSEEEERKLRKLREELERLHRGPRAAGEVRAI